jgi:hypothetical protein
MAMVRIIGASMLACFAVTGAALAEGAGIWGFQDDAVGFSPAGFSFGRTGEGRPGKWAVQLTGASA